MFDQLNPLDQMLLLAALPDSDHPDATRLLAALATATPNGLLATLAHQRLQQRTAALN